MILPCKMIFQRMYPKDNEERHVDLSIQNKMPVTSPTIK